jgi:two-component system, NtrC family, response regulator HydG
LTSYVIASSHHPADKAAEGWPFWSMLVVDDEPGMRNFLVKTLVPRCHFVMEAGSAEEGAERLRGHHVDLIILDISLPGKNGVTWLKELREQGYSGEVILITAFADLDTAIEALRAGASDFILKPFRVPQILNAIKHRYERARLARENYILRRSEPADPARRGALVGHSRAMAQISESVRRLAAVNSTVLLQGESGTGKELVARALHGLSLRAQGPFVPVNCASMSPELIESELFGHAKGAFTGAVKARRGLFEEADGGTLFIDEVTETSPAFQSKLLRALQEGEVRRVGESTSMRVDVRIVAATNRDIEQEVREKRFRQDLYYRLNVVTLRVPPLRERLEDVHDLARHFLERANARNSRRRRLSGAAVAHLMDYSFPGNVRELENLVEQAAALAESEELMPEDFPVRPQGQLTPTSAELAAASRAPGGPTPTLAEVVEEAERRAILQALERHQKDLARVADELGVSSTTLWRKMKRIRLPEAGAGSDPQGR